MQFSAIFYHFALISSHILIGGRQHGEHGMGWASLQEGRKETAEGAPNILGTPSWIGFRKDERQKNREFILCWLMENCEVFAISFLSIKKRKLESSSLVVAKIRSVTSKKRNICYAGGFCRGNEDATQKTDTSYNGCVRWYFIISFVSKRRRGRVQDYWATTRWPFWM